MRPFTVTELDRMRGAQESAMQDTCQLLAYGSTTTDRYGNPVPVYGPAGYYVCGFDASSREVQDSGEVTMTDARLRLPITAPVTGHDRIKLLTRYGETIEPEVYQVLGMPERGPSGLVLNLRLLTE